VKPTPQQEAVYDAVAAGRQHVLVEAVAGSGKTSTAQGSVGRLGRTPTGILELARALVPHIEAAPGAIEGEIHNVDPDDTTHLKPGDMVLSRRTAPLISLAFRLIARDVPCIVRGRDIGKGLITLVDDLKANGPVELIERLKDWQEAQLQKLERQDAPESALQAVNDRAACLIELAAAAATISALRERIDALFSDAKGVAGKVLLSSIHRAKGLEADRVTIIDTRCLPLILCCHECRGVGKAPLAGGGFADSECRKCGGSGTRSRPWEIQQERNLAYVAVTRAKKSLTFAGPIPALLGGHWQ
jgi:DNA helicase-2/ATP-dependent DNA helicase PcrA